MHRVRIFLFPRYHIFIIQGMYILISRVCIFLFHDYAYSYFTTMHILIRHAYFIFQSAYFKISTHRLSGSPVFAHLWYMVFEIIQSCTFVSLHESPQEVHILLKSSHFWTRRLRGTARSETARRSSDSHKPLLTSSDFVFEQPFWPFTSFPHPYGCLCRRKDRWRRSYRLRATESIQFLATPPPSPYQKNLMLLKNNDFFCYCMRKSQIV